MMKKLLLLLLLFLSLIGATFAETVETNILKLKTLNACESCNLQGANLYRAILSSADLSGADIRGANFRYAILCNTVTPLGIDNSGC